MAFIPHFTHSLIQIKGDGVFPGIGVPAVREKNMPHCFEHHPIDKIYTHNYKIRPQVALSGASAANAMVSPFQQWICLDELKAKNLI